MSDVSELAKFSKALSRAVDTLSAFEVVEHKSRELFDHILFTALSFDYDAGVVTRLYSNRADVSPTGGTKPFPSGIWADRIITDGSCYIGNDRQDLKDVFFDYEALWAIGCESVLNVSVRWRNRTVGSLNILGRAGQFDQDAASLFCVFGQLTVPLFLKSEEAALRVAEGSRSAGAATRSERSTA
jgi:hypothetical protein